jgi:hypothetical protein
MYSFTPSPKKPTVHATNKFNKFITAKTIKHIPNNLQNEYNFTLK